MNEKLDYVEMLEIPINTTSITYKPSKKKRKSKDLEPVKEEVLEKVNAKEKEKEKPADKPEKEKAEQPKKRNYKKKQQPEEEIKEPEVEKTVVVKSKEKHSFNVVAMQVALIFVLVGVILISNLYIEESGINRFLTSVFAPQQTNQTDDRLHSEFTVSMPIDGSVTVNNGVLNFSGKGSVYSPCEGKINEIIKEQDGKYTVTVKHSEKFFSVLTGLDYAYGEVGSTVYSNIPVGYTLGNLEVTFTSDTAILTDFSVDGETVIWQV